MVRPLILLNISGNDYTNDLNCEDGPVDFPEAGLTEQEEIDQILQDIEGGCCVGEFSETGEIRREEQTLFGRNGLPCSDIKTELLNRLVREGLLTVTEEKHPTLEGNRRRVYGVNRRKAKGVT